MKKVISTILGCSMFLQLGFSTNTFAIKGADDKPAPKQNVRYTKTQVAMAGLGSYIFEGAVLGGGVSTFK